MSAETRQVTFELFQTITGIKPKEIEDNPATKLKLEREWRVIALNKLGEEIEKMKDAEEAVVKTKWISLKNRKGDAEYDMYSNEDSRKKRVKEGLAENVAYGVVCKQYQTLATEIDLLEIGISHCRTLHQRTYGIPTIPIREA